MTGLIALLRRTLALREPGGVSRLAALLFFLAAALGSGVVLIEPQAAGWAGVALLASIGVFAVFLMIALLSRRAAGLEDAKRAAAAASAANVAWAVTGADGAVLDCNVVYRLLAGAGEGEPPAPPQLAFPGEGPAAALYRLSRAASERRAREESFESDSGQRLMVSVRPLRRGETAWWFAPLLPAAVPPRGVTEKRMPSALIRFADFFRNAPISVAVSAANGAILEANPVFERFFGLSRAAGVRIEGLLAKDERTLVLERIKQAAGGAVNLAPVEIHSEASEKTAGCTAQLFVSPFTPGPEGEARAILYAVDTSEQKALETQIAQSQKMQAIGQLAGGVAHDFNNLLQAIIGNCDLLLMRHTAGDPSFADINEVRQNSMRAAGLVRQLLAFSRQQTLQPRVLMLPDMLTELSLLLRRLVGERIDLKVEHAQDLWPVRADEGQISNAIVNLVVNARDAMAPGGGTVSIRSSNMSFSTPRPIGAGQMPAGDYVLIQVKDTGHGIDKENLAKIFDPFFTTKPVGQGTGLGLSTVYGIVKQTGGFITVESELSKGTAFQIYLPRHAGAVSAPLTAEEIERPPPRDVTGQDTVLLVEDEDAVRSFAARALKLRGYTVLEAPGGEAALEIVRAHKGAIDLLITDVVMPNMDGPTLVRAARRLRPEMRIIFMSGYAEDAFRRNEERPEELHFLPKPFGLKQLVAKVKEVLSGAPPSPVSKSLNDTGT